MKRLLAFALPLWLLAGCSLGIGVQPKSQSPRTDPTGEAPVGTMAPTPIPTLRHGRTVTPDDVSLSDDKRVLIVDFVGAPIYERENPCFHDYTVGANEVDGIMQLTVVELDPPPMQQQPLPSGVEMSCEAVGFSRHAEVDLAEPFTGTTVESGGDVFFVAPPKGLVELAGVPDGWSVVASEDLSESPSGRWQRSWSNADMLPHQSEPGRFDLIQAFSSNVGVTGGEQVAGPRVNGRIASLWKWDPTGELVLVWQVDGRGLALVANEADFAVEQLVELAESAYLPD